MNKTGIEWVKNPDGTQGYTWNPITGCLNHTPEGLCLGGMFPCYAYRLAHGRLKERYLANAKVADFSYRNFTRFKEALRDPFYPRFWPERLNELHDRNRAMMGCSIYLPKERGIFVCDMGELFGDWLPEDWTSEILNAIELNEGYDRFYLLTKQPQNLAKFSPFPKNCWVGVTATDRNSFLDACNGLYNSKANIRFISFEPLLGDISGSELQPYYEVVDWIILGAQTNPDRQPHPNWVSNILGAAWIAGIPVFLKDNLRWHEQRREWPKERR